MGKSKNNSGSELGLIRWKKKKQKNKKRLHGWAKVDLKD